MRCSLAIRLLLPATVAFAMIGPRPALAGEKSGAIHVEYVPPTNPAHQELYALLRERKSLEKLQTVFSPFRLPVDVKLRTFGCGYANAYFSPIDNVPTITLCYEYLQGIWDNLPKDTTGAWITPADALAGQFFFAAGHEFGHLAFSVYKIPLFGRQESAADYFSTYLMLQLPEDERRLIAGASYSYQHILTEDREQNSRATLRLAAFSSNHGQPEERFFNLVCIAYGSDAKKFADVVEKGWLPKSRAEDCKYEFDVLQFAFQQAVKPHIDQDRAGQVLKTDWLNIMPFPPPAR